MPWIPSGLQQDITFINGTVYKTSSLESVYDVQLLPYYDELIRDKTDYARKFLYAVQNTDPVAGKSLVEPYRDEVFMCSESAGKASYQRRNG